LLAGRQVDHGQAAVAHAKAGFGIQLAFVRAAVALAFVHAAEYRAVDFALAPGIEHPDNSAHAVGFLSFTKF
jgi:hypothetical protein